jgi:hypothetical protein
MTDIVIPPSVEEAMARAACRSVEEREAKRATVAAGQLFDYARPWQYLGYASQEAFIDAAWPNYVEQCNASFRAGLEAMCAGSVEMLGVMGEHGKPKRSKTRLVEVLDTLNPELYAEEQEWLLAATRHEPRCSACVNCMNALLKHSSEHIRDLARDALYYLNDDC